MATSKPKLEPTTAETLYAQRIASGASDRPEVDDPSFTPGVKAALAKIESTHQLVEVVSPNPIADRDLINQLLGQAQAFSAASSLLQTFGVSKLAFVKENKLYKALQGMNAPNGLELRGTWEEFCGLLGISDEKANTDIANLNAFGQEALESMTRMGIGYRDLAKFRKLPPDQRSALLEVANTGNKDDLLHLAEELLESERSARLAVEDKVAELEQDKKDTGKRINNMNAEIERNESTIKRLKQTRERLTEFTERTEDIREECLALQHSTEFHLNSIYKLFEEANKEGPDAPEIRLQIEQIWITANVAASRALDVVSRILENSMFEDLPNRVLGQHILTPEEASRWLLEYPMIEARHQAEKLAREEKREQAKPKGRGRPKGSTKADE